MIVIESAFASLRSWIQAMMVMAGAGEQYWICRGDMMRNLSRLSADLLSNLFTVGRVW
jgi:hypothetical protein